jgi:predicted PurR-regulated permease PerM
VAPARPATLWLDGAADDEARELHGEASSVADERTARRFFVLLLCGTLLVVALVVRPLAGALFMAAVLAGVLAPLHARLAAGVGGRPRLAAGFLVLAVAVVLAGPLVALAVFLAQEGKEALNFVAGAVRSEAVTDLVARLPGSVQRLTGEGLSRLLDLNQMVERELAAQGGTAAAAVWAAASATGSVLFAVVMMLIAFFFLLVQGRELVSWLDQVMPLRPGHASELLAEFKKVSYSVIVSEVITSAVQAVAALGGYLISGLPHPIFLAAVTFFVAFVPALGAASVCLLGAAVLFITGHPYASLFLALWGVAVVGVVDNVIRPLLIKAGMEMRSAVVFFSLIGGLRAFGAIGLVIGPLVVALFLAMLRIYRRDFSAAPGTGLEPETSGPAAPDLPRPGRDLLT